MERTLESLLVLDMVLDLEQRLVELRLDVLLLMLRGEGFNFKKNLSKLGKKTYIHIYLLFFWGGGALCSMTPCE